MTPTPNPNPNPTPPTPAEEGGATPLSEEELRSVEEFYGACDEYNDAKRAFLEARTRHNDALYAFTHMEGGLPRANVVYDQYLQTTGKPMNLTYLQPTEEAHNAPQTE